ncbi:MAG: 16S rRNA (cytidine(1402)-2'-O)-methyltransferase [Armatimonadetes bacterium]|nr:16S rRNA (cytidine(1402)-2'-O)-methyltransferase [Armatimonadota bacterium]
MEKGRRRGSQKGRRRVEEVRTAAVRERETRREAGGKGHGRIVLVATPLGNLGDLSPRARETLTVADLVAAEDTRVASRLLAAVGIPKKSLVRLDEHAGPSAISRVVERAVKGETVAFVTDAGVPGVSDPGADLVQAAVEAGLAVECVPGPSAVTAALALSGFYAQQYVFLGYPPRRPGRLRAALEPLRDSTMTLVLFESPHRVAETLNVAAEVLGGRRFAVCREMTKAFEEVIRGRLGEDEPGGPLKGEVTVVIEGRR